MAAVSPSGVTGSTQDFKAIQNPAPVIVNLMKLRDRTKAAETELMSLKLTVETLAKEEATQLRVLASQNQSVGDTVKGITGKVDQQHDTLLALSSRISALECHSDKDAPQNAIQAALNDLVYKVQNMEKTQKLESTQLRKLDQTVDQLQIEPCLTQVVELVHKYQKLGATLQQLHESMEQRFVRCQEQLEERLEQFQKDQDQRTQTAVLQYDGQFGNKQRKPVIDGSEQGKNAEKEDDKSIHEHTSGCQQKHEHDGHRPITARTDDVGDSVATTQMERSSIQPELGISNHRAASDSSPCSLQLKRGRKCSYPLRKANLQTVSATMEGMPGNSFNCSTRSKYTPGFAEQNKVDTQHGNTSPTITSEESICVTSPSDHILSVRACTMLPRTAKISTNTTTYRTKPLDSSQRLRNAEPNTQSKPSWQQERPQCQKLPSTLATNPNATERYCEGAKSRRDAARGGLARGRSPVSLSPTPLVRNFHRNATHEEAIPVLEKGSLKALSDASTSYTKQKQEPTESPKNDSVTAVASIFNNLLNSGPISQEFALPDIQGIKNATPTYLESRKHSRERKMPAGRKSAFNRPEIKTRYQPPRAATRVVSTAPQPSNRAVQDKYEDKAETIEESHTFKRERSVDESVSQNMREIRTKRKRPPAKKKRR